MRVLLLLVILPYLCSAETCPDQKTTCPSGQRCCDLKGEYSCCDIEPVVRGERKEYVGLEFFPGEVGHINQTSPQHAWNNCNWQTCSGTCCNGGCCLYKYADCCASNICCQSGYKCCGGVCCLQDHTCYPTTNSCCPRNYRSCGTWCCANNARCGRKFLTCGGMTLSIHTTLTALLILASGLYTFKSL